MINVLRVKFCVYSKNTIKILIQYILSRQKSKRFNTKSDGDLIISYY